MKPIIHVLASVVAMFCILGFWIASVVSELFLSEQDVMLIKQAILYGMLILIPAMAITGGSGFLLAGNRGGRFINNKKNRMKFIVLNGVLIMIPCAFFLSYQANRGQFDFVFYSVQTVELLMGMIQLILMGLNFRDGLRLAGK
ncbi:hypothetical protein [Thioflexithrix psekupsensis]|uniref:Uncharacterized protein n=1 Tax=Thioflexithrix psekupsensis TaxID=1570016 RepID=A0A251X7V3_9GAMM|nr:hypothetical protein [Thioflexithrix psekupsensis]OUD14076.1 hypothetical protein TPSD3_06980 [Thioflexithrix psekupsensis]